MPPSEQHKRQKVKNYTVLAIIFAMMALFFVISIIRVGGS